MTVTYIICIFFAVVISQFPPALLINESIFKEKKLNIYFYSTLTVLSAIFSIICSILFIPKITALLHVCVGELFYCLGIILSGVLYSMLFLFVYFPITQKFKLPRLIDFFLIITLDIVVFFILFLWLDNDFDKKIILSKDLDKYEIIKIDSVKPVTVHEMFLYTKDEISFINKAYILQPIVKLDSIINRYNLDSTLVDKKMLILNDSIKSILSSIQIEYSKVKSVAMNNDSIIGEFRYSILKDGRRKRYALLFCDNYGKRRIVDIDRKKAIKSVDLDYLKSEGIFKKIFKLKSILLRIRPEENDIDELFDQLKKNELKSINDISIEEIDFD